MVVLKNIITFIVLILFICNYSKASNILDYETETFIGSIIKDIKNANKFEKDISFKIVSDNQINAFVDQNNIIYITSGLIENCNDYVALISVIAHEIGHIQNSHIKLRSLNLNKLKKINAISNLSIISGSLISNNPELISSLAISSATSSNYYINFTKDQEREADHYALETLSKLEIYSNSIIKLLNKIEQKSLEQGLDKEKLKVSTHPYFEERIDIINYSKENKEPIFDIYKNQKFKFIQAKFIGYNGNLDRIDELEEPFKLYANSIVMAKNGKLKESMKMLNKLILSDKDNIFLLETKADILFSYGYIEESINFYKKVLSYYTHNYYAQIRIFENTNIEVLSLVEIENLFLSNLNLLEKFYNNKNILFTYLKISKKIKKKDWVKFLNYWLKKENDKELIMKNLLKFKNTKDKNLLKLTNLIYNNII